MPHRRACRIAAVTLALALSASAALAFPDDLIVERIGQERGFPSETITALYRDRAGFLWVGSREGLAVWDGYSVRIFEHSVGNADSLPDNSVRTIYEDRADQLWIGTNTGGLSRLDRATGRIESFRNDPSDPASLSHDSVYAVAEDRDGALWVGTQKGLNRFDQVTRKFERLLANSADPATIPGNYVCALKVDRKGRLWITTVGNGIAWIDPATRRVTRVPYVVGDDDADIERLVFAIAEDPAGGLWFGSEHSLLRYDETDKALHRVPVREFASDAINAIVTSIAVDTWGKLWIATWNAGLVAYDPATGTSRGYRHDPERPDSLGADRLPGVFADVSGDMWVGTWGNGINRFNANGDLFRSIGAQRPGKTGGLPYHEVTSVFQDRRGSLWVGTWGRGLCQRDGADKPFVKIVPPADPPLALNTVLSIAEQPDGTLWIGSMTGLFRRDPKTGVAVDARHALRDPKELPQGYVNALLVDRSGTLWVGTGGGGLNRLEQGGRSFTHFAPDRGDANSLSDDFITTLLEGSDGTLWVGTRSGGLNAFDRKSGRAVRFLPSATDAAAIGHHHVTSILESRRGVVWVGTDGGGLASIERDPGGGWHVTRVTADDGLLSQNVVSLLEDDDGSLWIGTRHGLSRFEPASGRVHNYGLGDGLPSVEFNPSAAWRSRDGLLMGTSRGLLTIKPGTPFVESPPAPTLITSIRTLTGPPHFAAAPWTTAAFEVPYGTPLTVAFAVLDFRPPHRFAYRLEGQGDSWTSLGASREMTFTDLAPGTYAMSVKGRSSLGSWSRTKIPLTIYVRPPFWMTWWFRIGGGVLLVGLVATLTQLRLRALARRNRELEELQVAREKALREARASQEELHGAYGRLRSLTRQLEDAKEEEKRRIAQELHDEMGQLLSAIKINLKVLVRAPEDLSQRSERLSDSIMLVDEMIGHVREMALDLRPPLLDELGLVPALRGYAEGQSMRTGVEIGVEANAEAENLRADTSIAAFRIVQEAVHNTLRHASATSITVSVRSDSNRLLLSVRDNGCGFDVAEALQRAATGRHLGLLGMRERVEALGGRLEIESAPGHGAEIRAAVPL